MEFATENYLSDLLINAENKGFESAKESFYECIANDQPAVEGTVRKDGTTALKVVGGILLAPLILIAGIVLVALSIVAAIIILIGKLITTIIKLPAIIAQAIKNSRVRKEIAEREKAGEIRESREGNSYFYKLKEYLEDNLLRVRYTTIWVSGMSNSQIVKFASDKYVEHWYDDLDPDDRDELREMMGQGELAKENVDRKYNSKLDEIKELRSKLMDSDVGFNFKVDESQAYSLIKTSNMAAKNLNHFKSIIEKYDKKLRNTKNACDKAKANKSTEVSLDNNCTFIDRFMVEMLKIAQVSLKHTGHAVGYISEWARESGRSGYANNKLNEARKRE